MADDTHEYNNQDPKKTKTMIMRTINQKTYFQKRKQKQTKQ